MSRSVPFSRSSLSRHHPDPAVSYWISWCGAARNRVELDRRKALAA